MSWVRKRRDKTEHRHVEDRLSAYLDGDLSPKERQVVHQHLAACRACQWHLDTLRQTVQWTRELPTIPVPRVFTIPAPAQPVPAPRQRRGWVPLLQGATALIALLLVVVVAGDIMLTNVLPPGSMPASSMPASSVPDLPPQPAAVMEQAVSEAAPTQVARVVEKEVVRESEAVTEEGESPPPEPDQALVPQAALPAEGQPAEFAKSPSPDTATVPAAAAAEATRAAVAEALRAEHAAAAQAESAEAPLALQMAGAPTPAPETGRMMATGSGPLVAEEKGVEAPQAVVVEGFVEEAELRSDEAEATPTAVAAVPQAEQPTAAAPAPVAPTIIAEYNEQRPTGAGDQDRGTMGVLRQPVVIWLRLAELGLGALLIVLGAITVVAVLHRRRTG